MANATSTRPARNSACAGRLEDIHRLIDGELSPRGQLLVRDHLRSCAGCESYHQSMDQVAATTRELLRSSASGAEVPRFATTKLATLRHLERGLRGDACDHLTDMASARLAESTEAPLHVTPPSNPFLTSTRRLRDLIDERKKLKEHRRHVKGPWNALALMVERVLSAETRNAVDVSQLVELALGMHPEDGLAHLIAAAVARAQNHGDALQGHLDVAARDANPKVRAMAHVNLASVAARALRFDAALRDLRVAQVYDESCPWLAYGDALFAFAAGATREAKRHLQALAEGLKRSRRADEFLRALAVFLPSDVSYLAAAHGLPAVAQAHFRFVAGQALPDLVLAGAAQRPWSCDCTLALFDLG
jgi:anti-sigma factor RsiW